MNTHREAVKEQAADLGGDYFSFQNYSSIDINTMAFIKAVYLCVRKSELHEYSMLMSALTNNTQKSWLEGLMTVDPEGL